MTQVSTLKEAIYNTNTDLKSDNISIEEYHSIEDVPIDIWDSMAPRDYVCLESAHLKAIERSGINNITPFHLIGTDDHKPIGIANFFIMDMDFSGLSKDISPSIRKIIKSWFPDFMTIKMLECGLISGTGEGIAASGDMLAPFLPAVLERIENAARDNGVDVVLFRDIPLEKYDNYFTCLRDKGYEPVLGYPSAVVSVPGETFEDYITSLKSSTRNNLKNHFKRLDKPEIKVEVSANFEANAQHYAHLLDNVTKKTTDYEHEKLNAPYLKEIDACLAEKSFVVTIKRYDEVIAFGLCLEGEKEIFALYCGINYDYNTQYQLYFNLILLTIKETLKRGKHIVKFGVTNYEYKLIIGCELQPLVYFVKHYAKPALTHALVKMLRESIEQPDNFHRPFHRQDIAGRLQLRKVADRIERDIKKEGDVFNRAFSYTRTDLMKIAKIYAFFPSFESAQNEYVEYQGRRVIMLGSNSYMGLGSHPALCRAAKDAIDKYGTGCSGSPILNGTLDIHTKLAHDLAEFMRKEDAILCSTGYQTNLGVIAAIAGRHDVLILDSLNHASIMDGAKFSYADVVRYEHDDMESLERILIKYADRNKFIVTDSVFSMEGTMANLPAIVRLAKKYNARLMLDEAHGIGVLGPGGRGAAEHFGLLDEADIVMGTFSKSFAGVGGFVAADAKVINYLRHVSRSHMFSASLPPPIVASVRKALDIIINEPERRTKLLQNAKMMADGLQELGYDAPYNNTAVVPVYCYDELVTLSLFKKLFDEGVYVNPVLSPAVPKGKELLRTSYMAVHDEEILKDALEVFKKVRTPYFPAKEMEIHGQWEDYRTARQAI